jgi:hypothetical protein
METGQDGGGCWRRAKARKGSNRGQAGGLKRPGWGKGQSQNRGWRGLYGGGGGGVGRG